MENKKNHVSSWERVCLARMQGRPTSAEYIDGIFDGFIELMETGSTGMMRPLLGAWLCSRAAGHRHWTAKGPQHKGESRAQFWYAPS